VKCTRHLWPGYFRILQMLLHYDYLGFFSLLLVSSFLKTETPYSHSETQRETESWIHLWEKKKITACIYPVPLGCMCYVEKCVVLTILNVHPHPLSIGDFDLLLFVTPLLRLFVHWFVNLKFFWRDVPFLLLVPYRRQHKPAHDLAHSNALARRHAVLRLFV
jgi:hypothetical protein